METITKQEITLSKYLDYTNNNVLYTHTKEIINGTKFTTRHKNPIFIGKVMDYLKDKIDSSEDQEKETTTLKEDLIYLSNDFQRVALYRNNILRVGRKNAFKEYLLGLPSNINIPFYYNEMFDLIAELVEDEKLKDETITYNITGGYYKGNKIIYTICTSSMCDFYYKMIEDAINKLLKINKLKPLYELEIIG